MSEPLAWVTGAGGLIGSHLMAAASREMPGWRILGITRGLIDLKDEPAVTQLFRAQIPSLVIHAAALSRGPACQADPALANRLNVEVTRHLTRLAAAIPFLFLSTDLVFDGRQGRYVEEHPVNPLSVYAETKAQAEREVRQNPRHSVVRLAINAGVSPTGDRSFTEAMRQAWERGETVTLFTDEFRSPLPAKVTARALWELARRDRPGLYHLGGSERLSRWEMGELVAARWPGSSARLRAGSLREYAGPPRPADVSLNCDRLQALLSFRLPGLKQWTAENPAEPI